LRLLAGALGTTAYVAGPDGQVPANRPQAWVWHEKTFGTGLQERTEWQPCDRSRRIGWVDGEDLYLEPEICFAVAQELARQQGDSLPVSTRTLWSRLKQRSLLASWDDTRQRNTVRRKLEGVKDREGLHLQASVLANDQPSAPSANHDQERRSQATEDGSGGRLGGQSDSPPEQPSADTVRGNGQATTEPDSGGRCGRSGTGEESSQANTYEGTL
jgi:hypothetical protein